MAATEHDRHTQNSERHRSVCVIRVDGIPEVRVQSAWFDRDRGEAKTLRGAVSNWFNDYRRLTGLDLTGGAVVTQLTEKETTTVVTVVNVTETFTAEYLPRYDQYGNESWERSEP